MKLLPYILQGGVRKQRDYIQMTFLGTKAEFAVMAVSLSPQVQEEGELYIDYTYQGLCLTETVTQSASPGSVPSGEEVKLNIDEGSSVIISGRCTYFSFQDREASVCPDAVVIKSNAIQAISLTDATITLRITSKSVEQITAMPGFETLDVTKRPNLQVLYLVYSEILKEVNALGCDSLQGAVLYNLPALTTLKLSSTFEDFNSFPGLENPWEGINHLTYFQTRMVSSWVSNNFLSFIKDQTELKAVFKIPFTDPFSAQFTTPEAIENFSQHGWTIEDWKL